MDESAFVFGTEYIDGDAADYARPVVITGHIANRDVYPKTQEISITIPFHDRVSDKQTSAIYDNRFAFSLVPYAPRKSLSESSEGDFSCLVAQKMSHFYPKTEFCTCLYLCADCHHLWTVQYILADPNLEIEYRKERDDRN